MCVCVISYILLFFILSADNNTLRHCITIVSDVSNQRASEYICFSLIELCVYIGNAFASAHGVNLTADLCELRGQNGLARERKIRTQ